jgi:hypothetical protein
MSINNIQYHTKHERVNARTATRAIVAYKDSKFKRLRFPVKNLTQTGCSFKYTHTE